MKGPLEGPHPMLHKHDKEFLFYKGWSIMKGEQIRKRVGVGIRFAEECRPGTDLQRYEWPLPSGDQPALIISSPFFNSPMAKLTEWH